MSCALAQRDCVPCKGGVPPLKGAELQSLHNELGADWKLAEEHHLEKNYKLKNWADAMTLANRISDLAESVNHHPDLTIGWGKVGIAIWTHKIDGLTESDFIFAAKVEEAAKDLTA